MNYSDNTAIKALKNGDEKAFIWIYNKYFLQLCFYAKKIVGDIVSTEDITQELFVKLWENRKKIDITTLNAYLYGSIRNACLKHMEYINVRNNYHNCFLDKNREADNEDNPISMLIAKEAESKIQCAIDALPKQCKMIFLMWWKEELKYKEIAAKSRISLSTVRTQITRAKNKLKEDLKSLNK